VLNRQLGIIGFHQHQINCIVGILPDERIIERLLWVDLKVKIDFSRCLRSGSIDNTVDYSQLASFCTNLSRDKCYGLIEAFAADIITGCFEQFLAEWAWVCIKKPSAIPTAAYAFVEMEQHRK
jgi:dihydroneopterin aldolase